MYFKGIIYLCRLSSEEQKKKRYKVNDLLNLSQLCWFCIKSASDTIVTATCEGYWKNYLYKPKAFSHLLDIVQLSPRRPFFYARSEHLKTELLLHCLFPVPQPGYIYCLTLEKAIAMLQKTLKLQKVFFIPDRVAGPERLGGVCRVLLKKYKVFQGVG